MRKKALFSVGILLLCLAAYGFYLYNKPHTSVAAVSPAFTVNAADLYAAYRQNETTADKEFLDKIVQVKGTVKEVSGTDSTLTILLDSHDTGGGVSCSIASPQPALPGIKIGQFLTVKGRCSGFLADVSLVDCVVEK